MRVFATSPILALCMISACGLAPGADVASGPDATVVDAMPDTHVQDTGIDAEAPLRDAGTDGGMPDVGVDADTVDSGGVVYASCEDAVGGGRGSRAYTLKAADGSSYPAYCLIDPLDGATGWNLVLKAGKSNAFAYDSKCWEPNASGAACPSDVENPVRFDETEVEARYPSYTLAPVTEVKVVMRNLGTLEPTSPDPEAFVATSLAAALNSGTLSGPAGDWDPTQLLSGALMQGFRLKGFNVKCPATSTRVRIGLIGNELRDVCNGPDSWVGIGGKGYCAGASLSVGNESCWTQGNGTNKVDAVPGFAWVYVR